MEWQIFVWLYCFGLFNIDCNCDNDSQFFNYDLFEKKNNGEAQKIRKIVRQEHKQI